MAIYHFKRIETESSKSDEDDYHYVSPYLQIGEQESTYTQEQVINGVKYLVIGFDTAHHYNNDSHDFDYVFSETVKILTDVNSIINS